MFAVSNHFSKSSSWDVMHAESASIFRSDVSRRRETRTLSAVSVFFLRILRRSVEGVPCAPYRDISLHEYHRDPFSKSTVFEWPSFYWWCHSFASVSAFSQSSRSFADVTRITERLLSLPRNEGNELHVQEIVLECFLLGRERRHHLALSFLSFILVGDLQHFFYDRLIQLFNKKSS